MCSCGRGGRLLGMEHSFEKEQEWHRSVEGIRGLEKKEDGKGEDYVVQMNALAEWNEAGHSHPAAFRQASDPIRQSSAPTRRPDQDLHACQRHDHRCMRP
jgi:hypothetical protein